jgi:hypothetical protein
VMQEFLQIHYILLAHPSFYRVFTGTKKYKQSAVQ